MQSFTISRAAGTAHGWIVSNKAERNDVSNSSCRSLSVRRAALRQSLHSAGVCASATGSARRCLNRPTAISHSGEINSHLSLPISNKIHKHGHSRTSDNGKCGGRIAFLRHRASACHRPFDIACARPFSDSKSFLMRSAAINSMNIANKTKWRLMRATRQEIAKNCIKQQRPLSLSYHKTLSLSLRRAAGAAQKMCMRPDAMQLRCNNSDFEIFPASPF